MYYVIIRYEANKRTFIQLRLNHPKPQCLLINTASQPHRPSSKLLIQKILNQMRESKAETGSFHLNLIQCDNLVSTGMCPIISIQDPKWLDEALGIKKCVQVGLVKRLRRPRITLRLRSCHSMGRTYFRNRLSHNPRHLSQLQILPHFLLSQLACLPGYLVTGLFRLNYLLIQLGVERHSIHRDLQTIGQSVRNLPVHPLPLPFQEGSANKGSLLQNNRPPRNVKSTPPNRHHHNS